MQRFIANCVHPKDIMEMAGQLLVPAAFSSVWVTAK
jgi:hypothetical protein